MTGMDSNYCQIVRDSLTKKKGVDEQTFASLAVLTERLERVRGLGEAFSKVGFSPAVKRLKTQKDIVAVG